MKGILLAHFEYVVYELYIALHAIDKYSSLEKCAEHFEMYFQQFQIYKTSLGGSVNG